MSEAEKSKLMNLTVTTDSTLSKEELTILFNALDNLTNVNIMIKCFAITWRKEE